LRPAALAAQPWHACERCVISLELTILGLTASRTESRPIQQNVRWHIPHPALLHTLSFASFTQTSAALRGTDYNAIDKVNQRGEYSKNIELILQLLEQLDQTQGFVSNSCNVSNCFFNDFGIEHLDSVLHGSRQEQAWPSQLVPICGAWGARLRLRMSTFQS
jgi:hypothetical protein